MKKTEEKKTEAFHEREAATKKSLRPRNTSSCHSKISGVKFSRSEKRKIKRFSRKCIRLTKIYTEMAEKNRALKENSALVVLFNAEGESKLATITGKGLSIVKLFIPLFLKKEFRVLIGSAMDFLRSEHKPDATDSKPGNETESKPE